MFIIFWVLMCLHLVPNTPFFQSLYEKGLEKWALSQSSKGKGMRFTGLRYGLKVYPKKMLGDVITSHNKSGKLLSLNCDQGVLLFVHGSKSGEVVFDKKRVSPDVAFGEVIAPPHKKIYMVSCYNGCKKKPCNKNWVLVDPEKSCMIFVPIADGDGIGISVPKIVSLLG